MSGLLVKSTLIMRDNLEELNRLDKSGYPIILGGAALTRTYVEKDLRALYKGRVFYGKDAFEGLHLLDRLMEIKRSGVDDPSFGTELSGRKLPPRRSVQMAEDRPGDASGALCRGRHGQRAVRAPVPRHPGRQGHPPRRHRLLPERDGAVPQPMGLPPRARRGRRRLQGTGPGRAPGAPRRGEGRRAARPSGRLGLLPGELRRKRPRRLQRRPAHNRARTFRLPAPGQGALPVHRRLLPAGGVGASATTPPSRS